MICATHCPAVFSQSLYHFAEIISPESEVVLVEDDVIPLIKAINRSTQLLRSNVSAEEFDTKYGLAGGRHLLNRYLLSRLYEYAKDTPLDVTHETQLDGPLEPAKKDPFTGRWVPNEVFEVKCRVETARSRSEALLQCVRLSDESGFSNILWEVEAQKWLAYRKSEEMSRRRRGSISGKPPQLAVGKEPEKRSQLIDLGKLLVSKSVESDVVVYTAEQAAAREVHKRDALNQYHNLRLQLLRWCNSPLSAVPATFLNNHNPQSPSPSKEPHVAISPVAVPAHPISPPAVPDQGLQEPTHLSNPSRPHAPLLTPPLPQDPEPDLDFLFVPPM
jgi:hypothetical protein